MTTRVLLVDIHSSRASLLRAALEDAGFSVVGTVASEQDLYAVAAKLTPDAIIVDAASPSRDSLEHLAVLEQRFPKPLLMLSANDDRKLLAAAAHAGVSAYVVEGISPALVRSLVDVAIQQYNTRQNLQSELKKAKDSLESRKLVERAKSLLMEQSGLSEADAYARLRKTAMNRGQPIVELARTVLEQGAMQTTAPNDPVASFKTAPRLAHSLQGINPLRLNPDQRRSTPKAQPQHSHSGQRRLPTLAIRLGGQTFFYGRTLLNTRISIAGLVASASLLFAAYASAKAADDPAVSLEAALTGGEASVNARLRYEDVRQNNPLRDGHALTARLRLGYQTGIFKGLDALVEYEGVYAIGGDDNYNSGPPILDNTNGNTGFSVIADPTGDEVNRAWLRYAGLPDTRIKIGRQRLILDNARFIGNVGWRHDEQTFDAITLINKSLANTTLTYAYLRRNNFIFFNENKLDAHLINANWSKYPWLNLSGYGYFVDFRDDNNPRVPGTPDHRILGLRASGRAAFLSYALEYADQSDYADSPNTVDAKYYLAELGASLGPVTPKIGYEVLAGDGTFGFSTPFGTNHAFQGWADVFLNTPPGGIRDAYVSLSGTAAKFKLAAIYHDFQSDQGSVDYGSEIDLLIARPVTKRLSVLVKYADYSADNFAVDTRRYWIQAEYKF